jgi:hypothetical protein
MNLGGLQNLAGMGINPMSLVGLSGLGLPINPNIAISNAAQFHQPAEKN